MKKFIVILVVLLSLTVSFSGCKKNEPTTPVKPNEPSSPTIVETEYDFISNRTSEYSILLPENAPQYVTLAEQELNTWLKESADVVLPVVIDDGTFAISNDAKIISLGNTSAIEFYNIDLDEASLGRSGYSIYRKGRNIIIADGSSDGFGVIQGVYDFLSKYIDFDTLGPDCVYYEQVESLKLLDYNTTSIPAIDFFVGTAGELPINALYRVRMNTRLLTEYYGTIPGTEVFHNTLQYVPYDTWGEVNDEWFNSNGSEVCLTAHGLPEKYDALVKYVADQIINGLDRNPDLHDFTFTQMDGNNACGCSACTAVSNANGGSKSALYMLFLNDVAEYVDAHYAEKGETREWCVFFLVYDYTFDAPLKEEDGDLVPTSERCNPHVAPYICAKTGANWNESLDSESNRACAEMYDQWKVLSNRSSAWIYTANYSDFLAPYNAFTQKQGTFQFLRDKEIKMLYDNQQMDMRTSTGFAVLANYMNGKLSRNADADVNAMIDRFMSLYFKNAAPVMKTLFEDIVTRYNYNIYVLGMSTRNPTVRAEDFPFAVCREWKSLIDAALSRIEYLKELDAEEYESLQDRIILEGLSIDYLLIDLHSAYYTDEQLLEMKQTFRNNATRLNITYMSEGNSISQLYERWNIN